MSPARPIEGVKAWRDERIVFDLKRLTTAISSTGTVHLTEAGGLLTTCGLDLEHDYRKNWTENLLDKQPDCRKCIRRATLLPTLYPYVKRVTLP